MLQQGEQRYQIYLDLRRSVAGSGTLLLHRAQLRQLLLQINYAYCCVGSLPAEPIHELGVVLFEFLTAAGNPGEYNFKKRNQ